MELFKKSNVQANYDEINEIIKVTLQESPQSIPIKFLIKLPKNFPHTAPLVEQLTPLNDKALNDQILARLNQATAEYLELQNFVDVFLEVLTIIKQHSSFVCAECKEFKCPTCNKDLYSSISGVIGENNCYRKTKCCGSILHECCWKFFIRKDQRCPICGQAISRY